ncbi:cellulase family glycosylhydrolase [Saccharophagus degradans]|uniref:Cellulase family glycosylhydrolase n=1 Tax=Saccharophagus degradans TaxID=86304 RepID=A0AAW7X8F7_9GAMM|nr:cellulase family glycosylhydrolase [Saccharophagus degradans]MDO6423869.1 cellulase family glycosylhydrolase [Saccharophagus degradans]MDO6607948.1 cellulase family glycosylhydrolase [Saccharophagus degradans]
MTIETLRPSSGEARTFLTNFLRASRQFCGFSLIILMASLASTSAFAGFSVSGTQLLDGNGQPFIMRGVNHAHTWYPDQTDAFSDIANTGANTIRVVLSDGQQWTRNSAADVANVISLCKQNELVCVLEVHDATGYGEASAAGTLSNVAQYWVDIADVLRGQEDYVIINIANEPYGNTVAADAWATGHQAAIRTLRGAGLTHTLMVDAANWGQDWSNTMLQNASSVASADSLGNTMFSVHMYEVYQNRSTIENYVTTFLNSHNLPLVVGEFGADHGGNFVDADSILAVSEQYGIGYIGWSWSGNGSCCYSLDIVNNFDASSLSTWGDRLINGTNGIKQTSQIATIYSSISSSAMSGSTATSCNWYGSTFPVCSSQTSGWGWENNQSCIARTTCSEQPAPYGLIETSSSSAPNGNSCGTAANGYPVCCGGSGSDPDGDGWGWENSQSCVVQPTTSKWETLIDGNSFSNYSTFESHWNYLYPWGSDHNGSARMYANSANHKQVYLEGGNVLVLKANPVAAIEGKSTANPYPTIKYHSGAVHAKSQVLVSDQYPDWEVRGEFQAPTSKGTWPAFWLTGAWTWPPELDILEFKGSTTNWFNTFRSASDVSTTKVSVDSPNNWHQYRAWITKVNATDVDVHYYIDGKWHAVHRASGFVGKPMWVIINLQMEGSSGAFESNSDTYFRARNLYIGRSRSY